MTTTRNPFDALGEDYDPSASLNKPVAPSSAKPGADEPKEILAKQTTSKKRDPSKQTAGESRRGTEYSSRGGAARGGKSRGPQNANEQYSKDKGTGHDANAAKPIEDTVSRGTARGRGRGRGSGSRREFDRRNASGKTDTPKATEQAWGDEAEAQQTAVADPTDARDPAAPEPASAETDAAAPAEEEEDNTVSYEEYLKQKAQKALSFSAPAIRKANEGADDSKWGNQALTKENDQDAYFAGISKAKAGNAKERKQKETLDIEQRFYQAPSAPRGRGEGRGRGRGTRGRGEGRGEGRGRGAPRGAPRGASKPASAGASLTLSDETAFPSLS